MAERFFLPHNPVKGRQGGQPPGFLVSQACSPLGPVRMFPPQLLVGVAAWSPRRPGGRKSLPCLLGLTHGS